MNSIENRIMYWVYVFLKFFLIIFILENRVYKKLEIVIRNWDFEFGYKMFVLVNVCLKGICYLGIKFIECKKNNYICKLMKLKFYMI